MKGGVRNGEENNVEVSCDESVESPQGRPDGQRQ